MNSPGIHAHLPHPREHISPAFIHTTYIHMHTRTLHTLNTLNPPHPQPSTPSTPSTLHTLTGDSCCNPNCFGRIKDMVEKEVPGIYMNSIQMISRRTRSMDFS